MWLQRTLARIQSAAKPLLLIGGEAAGVPFLLDRLSQETPLVWIALHPAEAGDPVAQGNRLAEGINEFAGVSLLPHGMPHTVILSALKQSAAALPPFTLALSRAELSPSLLDSLLNLDIDTIEVILDVSQRPLRIPPQTSILEHELCLLDQEAQQIANDLPAWRCQALLERSGRHYLSYLLLVHDERGEAPPTIPFAGKTLKPERYAEPIEATHVLDALLESGDLIRALELAVLRCPERVPEILPKAGPVYHEQGLHQRLHYLLESLDEHHQHADVILCWRLVAGVMVGSYQHLIQDIEQALQQRDAPELRARYAGIVPNLLRRRVLAAQAAERARTPLTLWQLGRVHPDPRAGIDILRDAVQLSEQYGSAYDMVRSAGTLGSRLTDIGHYREALGWLEWALARFDHAQLKDGMRRVWLMNDLISCRIMLGQAAGLDADLQQLEGLLEAVEISANVTVILTRAEYLLSQSRSRDALNLTASLFGSAPRSILGEVVLVRARALSELGHYKDARQLCENTLGVLAQEAEFTQLPALLAHAMILALQGDQTAREPLRNVMLALEASAPWRTAAALHLALLEGHPYTSLHEAPAVVKHMLADLSREGLKVLSGPEAHFSHIWATVLNEDAELTLNVLGKAEAFQRGRPLEVSEQQLEVLSLLALHSDGLSSAHLSELLGADQKPVSTRAMVSRLRNIVPIDAKPYRLAVPVRMDALEVKADLEEGRLREAVSRYHGAVLPDSDAPGVREFREQLEEQLRDTLLSGHDSEALLGFARSVPDDLEVWERLAKVFPPLDPRRLQVNAQVRRLAREYGVDHEDVLTPR